MNEPALLRVERVCAELATSGQPITFTTVAEHAQISRATLYRDHQLRAIVDEHRTRQTDARTLTGLATEVAHLRTAVEALAAGVKRHEEQLRKLTKQPPRR
jgi:nicotinamidase-related amidase